MTLQILSTPSEQPEKLLKKAIEEAIAIDQQLQTDDGEREGDESRPVELGRAFFRDAFDEGHDEQKRDYAQRHDQVENPAPVVRLCELADSYREIMLEDAA